VVAVGDGDLLGRAGTRRDQDLAAALELATESGAGHARAGGLRPDPDCRADLTLVPAEGVGAAVVAHPPRSLVLKSGRVVASCADSRS
jgi:cytosine deaminase